MSKVCVCLLALSVLMWGSVAYAAEPPKVILESSVGDVVVPTTEVSQLQELVNPVAMQQSSACVYTAQLTVMYWCVDWQSNPFGYFYLQTYRWGDVMTWDHYTLRRNYRGYGISCPLNERFGSPYSIWICGFPPD